MIQSTIRPAMTDHATDIFPEAVAFFEAKNTLPCSACGHKGWTMIGTKLGEFEIGFAAVKGPGKGQEIGQLPIIAVSCDNCGFCRPHLLSAITQWAADNAEKVQAAREKIAAAGNKRAD